MVARSVARAAPYHAWWWCFVLASGAAIAVAIANVGAQQLPAADQGLLLSSTLEKLVETRDADGAVRFDLVAGEDPVTAQQFVYSVQFTNALQQSAEAVRITGPIPPGLRYVDGSAVGPGSVTLFSIDGGSTFGAANELLVADDVGLRPATAADYTHVRWVLRTALEARATGFVRFRAVSR